MSAIAVGPNTEAPPQRAPAEPDGAGLAFPDDLRAWTVWQRGRRPLHQRLRHRVVDPAVDYVLTSGGPDAEILIALEGSTPSIVAALEDPCRRLDPSRVAVVDRRPRTDLVGSGGSVNVVRDPRDVHSCMPRLRRGLTIGAHLPIGNLVQRTLDAHDGHGLVAQHGLLTPFAPPLPANVTLLAWSGADGRFWSLERPDVTVIEVGSQLLWDAARRPVDGISVEDRPVFLGQLHAAEFPRRDLISASLGFCRGTGARYRPHPAEVDRISRLHHAHWKRRGVEFESTGRSLTELGSPVVAVFSGGLVEAAAAGIPAWAYHPNPPDWLNEFWNRYGISRWGQDPTPVPEQGMVEPAATVARILQADAVEPVAS